MRTVYVEYKDLSDLLCEFRLRYRSVELQVYVWKSLRGLHRNTNFKGSGYVGAYVAYPYRKSRGLFGEMHLVKKWVGAGYVAHELQHFFYDWLMEQSRNEETNERQALMAGEITKQFWSEYYDHNASGRNRKA